MIEDLLGQAAFSRAVLCKDLKTEQYVCVKIITNNKDFFDQSIDEIKVHRSSLPRAAMSGCTTHRREIHCAIAVAHVSQQARRPRRKMLLEALWYGSNSMPLCVYGCAHISLIACARPIRLLLPQRASIYCLRAPERQPLRVLQGTHVLHIHATPRAGLLTGCVRVVQL